MKLEIIAAVAENGVIGNKGKMPWHISEDLQRFKKLTMGNAVIMGRNTYRSITNVLGKPLPGRFNIVLANKCVSEEVVACDSIEDALDYCGGRDIAYIIGGANVYKQFMPLATAMELTLVHKEYEGDAYFPSFSLEDWKEVKREDKEDYSFIRYERK